MQQDHGGSSFSRVLPGAAESASPSSLQGAPEHPSRERSRWAEEASIVWHCEARASQKRSRAQRGKLGRLKRRKEKGTLGTGTSLSSGLWSHQGVNDIFGMLCLALSWVPSL